MAMADKGEEYVARWAPNVSSRAGLSSEWVATTMVELGYAPKEAEGRLRMSLLRGEATPEVGALEPEQAKAVVAALTRSSEALARSATTHCHCCGLRLKRGECPACGEPLF